MNEADALEILQKAMWTIMMGAGPSVAVGMAVGLIVALFQALTQIQESSLTFVPKIVAVFLVTTFTASFMGGQISGFTEQTYSRIERGF
jgi:flagellar biosynthetic protein FliQ